MRFLQGEKIKVNIPKTKVVVCMSVIFRFFYAKGAKGVDATMFKLFLLLYADDITVFTESPEGLKNGLDILKEYCSKWKLTVNIEKSKIIVF